VRAGSIDSIPPATTASTLWTTKFPLKVFTLDEKALAAGVSCRFVDDGNSITDFNTELQWMETSNVDGVQKPADPTDAHNVYT